MFRKTDQETRNALAWTRLEMLHLAGKSVAAIAADEGLTVDWVRQKLRRLAREPERLRQRRFDAARAAESARVDALIIEGDYVKAGQLARTLTAHNALLARETRMQATDKQDRDDADDGNLDDSPEQLARRRVELCRKLVRAAEARGDVERGTWERISTAAAGGSPV